MKLVKLSEDPMFLIIKRCIKLKWDLRRNWNSIYLDLDTYNVFDTKGNILYENINFESLDRITHQFQKSD